jgi:hypothetical protein
VTQSILADQFNQGEDDYRAQLQKKGQDRLRYAIYDQSAFLLDHNIPRGFSEAMLAGNSDDQANMIGQYAFNALKFGTPMASSKAI